MDPILKAEWLRRCIAGIEALPPCPSRTRTLTILRQELEECPASNVIPLFGRAA